jgi:DNA repair protein RecO (recombination protein O)
VNLTDRALILRRFRYGETSLVLQLLTREHGRVHVIARGAYRPSSRYYAVLDLFDTLELNWSRVASRELQNLREATLLDRRAKIPLDLDRYRAALGVLELASVGARLDQPTPELFDLTAATLDALAAGLEPPELAQLVFELRFLTQLGLMPALTSCAACAGPAPETEPGSGRAAFSAGAGGRLCTSHAAEARSTGRRVGTLPVDVLETAKDLFEGGLSSATAGTIRAPELERVRDFVVRFLEYHLESRPRSYRRFLAAPNRNRPRAPAR